MVPGEATLRRLVAERMDAREAADGVRRRRVELEGDEVLDVIDGKRIAGEYREQVRKDWLEQEQPSPVMRTP